MYLHTDMYTFRKTEKSIYVYRIYNYNLYNIFYVNAKA